MLRSLLLWILASDAHAFSGFCSQMSALRSVRLAKVTMRGAEIPEVVIGKTRLALATKRTVGDEDEIRVLWETFKKCYATEALAIEAAEKNSNVFNPQLNSPTKITGTYKLLVKRFGKKEAQELIFKNPGVLICSPQGLEKETDESILKAADLAAWLDENKPLVRLVARTTGAVFFGSIFCARTQAKGRAHAQPATRLAVPCRTYISLRSTHAIADAVSVKNAPPGADMSPAGILQQLIDSNPYFNPPLQ